MEHRRFAELHVTAWCYNSAPLQDIQYIRWAIINKSTQCWDSTIASVFADVDIGDAFNDYAGADTTRKLGFCNNAANYDPVYGNNPPAAGIVLLKGAVKRNVIPNIHLGLTSFICFTNPNGSTIMCEMDPYAVRQVRI